MADEHVEGNSPRSTSEATPPHVDDSPEMVSHPSPPEEERVTSSTDRQPSEIADSPDEQRVSSTFQQELNDGAGPSSRESAAGQSSSEHAPEIENQPNPDEPSNPVIRQLLQVSTPLLQRDEPDLSRAGEAGIHIGLVRAAIEAVQTSLEAARIKAAEGGQIGSQEIAKYAAKRNVDEKSDDSNQQFDVEELSPASKSSENVDLGSDLSPTWSGVSGEERRDSGSSATEDTGLGSDSSPRRGDVIEEESSLGIGAEENASLERESSASRTGVATLSSGTGATEDVGLKSELSASRTGAAMPGSGTGTTEDVGFKSELSASRSDAAMPVSAVGATKNVGLKSELSPSKTVASSVEGSGSASGTPEMARDSLMSPKRKSPTKVQHLPPKRSAPFTSPGGLQKQSDSHMSTLLEELDIKEAKVKPGSSEPISGHEQKSMEMEESNDSQKEETEQESNMEVQETDSQKERGETAEKYPKNDDTGMEDSD
ncbi:hypothetical protein AVEN_47166-1 [Araneus ventricosus]|uniref:Uncharacterized protein n=1 Tax=Araneus ventricosus TaxID=182803 RepID=A0A4Y2N4J7_ARAVE|nr:hypothetical protein AVEN_47166-1 [Araneus ventricosus]